MQTILQPSSHSASPIFSAFPSLSTLDVEDSASKPQSAGRRHGFCGEAAGLVHSETSDTGKPQTHLPRLLRVDRKATRYKKLKCSTITAARLHEKDTPKGFRKGSAAFLTPTYRPDVQWEPRHISDLLERMRHWLERRGHKMRFVWVMELQKNGRPHYHILIWLPKGLTLPKPDKQGWWPHGMTNIQRAKNPVGYIAKYASKGENGGFSFPAGARTYGSGGLIGDSLDEARWWKLPLWARELSMPDQKLRRRIGGGILIPDTGEILVTPWRVLFQGGEVFIYRVDWLAAASID